MAANHVNKKRKLDSSYKNCPKAMLKVVPDNCSTINFSDLIPGENCEYKAIIGKVHHLYPIGQRMGGHVRKVLVTDALTDCEDLPKLTIFLLDQFAKDSNSAEVEGFIVVTNFTVEKLTHNKNDIMPVQILVQKEESNVWFGRKRVKEKRKSKSPNPRKRQRISDDEESHAVVTHQYEYTKLGDLVETDGKDSYNVYGIVDKCDLRITQGKKMQILDLSLTDQTETGFSCIVFAGGGETVPDVYPGDIVRIHRMQVNKFRGKLRGRCPNPKFILVFSKDNEGNKPRTVAKTFTFTPEDITRFRELFEWNKSKNDPKLISEIRKDDFANIICQVIGVYIAKTTEAVILKLWDGTKTDVFPGVHWAMNEERLDQRLFTVARNYYIVLSVYGHHTAVAAELEPGQYIEVRDAHLYSPKDNPDDCKLCLHTGNKEGRGISVLPDTDSRLEALKERLDKVIADTLEFGNQTDDLLSQNNSIFLNCDISVFNSQPSEHREENGVDEPVPSEEQPPVSNGDDVEMLNEPLLRNDASSQNEVVAIIDVSIKPGQSTQEFGLGMPRDDTLVDNENRPSVASEPDPTSNMTPFQTRNYIHDPLQLSSQMTSSIFPSYSSTTDEEWWNSMPSAFASVTDGHSDIKPTSLAEVVRHSVPDKFRILTVVLCFKPEATSIQKFIHLFCPKCSYLSEDASPSIEPFEMREGLPYYICPECSKEEANNEQCSLLEYTFLISFSLHDGSGVQSIEAYIWKENAVKFFKNITPEEALRDSATADSILHMLWNICPNCRPFDSSTHETTSVYPVLDCCILSYSAAYSTHYQLFDTVLI